MSISRLQNPEEFFDITNPMLLQQPEPQYPYAQLALGALGIDLNPPGSVGMSGREISGQGPSYAAFGDAMLRLMGELPGSLFASKVDFKGGPGHTMRFNRPLYANTTYTEASRQIGTNQTISTTAINVQGEQTSLTVKRYGGPYDSANSRVAPLALDKFDATMGVHNLASMVGLHLKRDFHRTLDTFWVTKFDQGSAIYPEGMSAVNDATAKGQYPLSYELLSRVSRDMDDANLPTLPDGKRVMVVTTHGKKQLKDDPQFARYAQFHGAGINPLFPGYFDSTPEFHLFVSNTLNRTANGSGINIHYGHAIAPGAGLIGMGEAPYVASSSDDNFGLTSKVLWIAHLAQDLADSSFVRSVRYTEDVA